MRVCQHNSDTPSSRFIHFEIKRLTNNSNITMKKTIIIALMALAIVAVPASAQTRKDKKAAEKAQWEQEQKFAAEEAALRHQLKMDSLANAKRVAEEKAAEAAARAKERAEAQAAQEQEVVVPCSEYYSTAEIIRALGVGEDYDQQMATELARVAALEELASQVNTSVQAIVSNYKKAMRINLTRESKQRMEGMALTAVDESMGYRIACRKTTSKIIHGEKLYKQYMVLEVNKDDILEPIYEGIQNDDELALDMDYQKFAEEFDKNCQQDMQ